VKRKGAMTFLKISKFVIQKIKMNRTASVAAALMLVAIIILSIIGSGEELKVTASSESVSAIFQINRAVGSEPSPADSPSPTPTPETNPETRQPGLVIINIILRLIIPLIIAGIFIYLIRRRRKNS
jgi:hypothetical protein